MFTAERILQMVRRMSLQTISAFDFIEPNYGERREVWVGAKKDHRGYLYISVGDLVVRSMSDVFLLSNTTEKISAREVILPKDAVVDWDGVVDWDVTNARREVGVITFLQGSKPRWYIGL